MNAIPNSALAVMKAAAEDYRLTTPPEQTTPAGVIERIAEYLLAEGYEVRPAIRSLAPRGLCCGCGHDYALTTAGRIRWHDVRGRSGIHCPGSRKPPAPVRVPAALGAAQ